MFYTRIGHYPRLRALLCSILIFSFVFALAGCSSGGDDNAAPQPTPPVADTTPGASWASWVMQQIGAGIFSWVDSESIGWLLSAFGGGGSSSDVTSAINYITVQLNQIEKDLTEIQTELGKIAYLINIDTDEILSESQQNAMDPALTSINNEFENLNLMSENYKPGSKAAVAAASDYACAILNAGQNYDMDYNVSVIYQIITNEVEDPNGGALNSLTSMLVAMAGDGQLSARYKTLESYFNSLLEAQMRGATLMVEALHARDNPFVGVGDSVYIDCPQDESWSWPGTADQWWTTKFLPQIADEVEEFLRCTDRLVMADADLRTNIGLPIWSSDGIPYPAPFLPPDADYIFSRADFLAAQMSPNRHSFGVVVRAVGEPDSIKSYTDQNQPPRVDGKLMTLTPLGTDSEPFRQVPVEVWNNWQSGATQAYMQWNWGSIGIPPGDWLSFNAATTIAVAKYERHLPYDDPYLTWALLDWDTTEHERLAGAALLVYLNDKMERDFPKGHPWGHATLAVRHRPIAWQRTQSQESYDSDYFDVTNAYSLGSVDGTPWVKLSATMKTDGDRFGLMCTLESGVGLFVQNGMNEESTVAAVVKMIANTSYPGQYGLKNSENEITCSWDDESGETVSHSLREGHVVYPGSTLSHDWGPGEAAIFDFYLNFHNNGSGASEGDGIEATMWPDYVYLFFR